MEATVQPTSAPALTLRFQLIAAWIAASLVALAVALTPMSATWVDGQYVPVGPDAFYHARRMLDAVAHPGSFYQFDALIHAPEGSLIIWPWGYDYLMSLLVRMGLALHLSSDAMSVLVHLPPLAFTLALALTAMLCRALQLSPPATLFAMLATALFPLNQGIYGIGSIDHHFAEHLAVLASLTAGIAWLRRPELLHRAVIAGALIGIAPAIHTGLFILQLPLVVTFVYLWARGVRRPRRSLAFAVALVAATLAVSLPSLALRTGHFELYTLSWFHVYIAACSGAMCVLLARFERTRSHLLILGTLAVGLTIPLIASLRLAEAFFGVSVAGMDQISEVQSVLGLLQQGGLSSLVGSYSLLLLLAPFTMVLSAWQLWREERPERALLWIASMLGIVMLLMQLRLHYFGSFALFVPWLLLLEDTLRVRPERKSVARLAVAGALLIALIPGLKARVTSHHVAADDPYYDATRQLYPTMTEACAHHPGTVLANVFDGHYIRYHTGCAVIANPFLLTPLHERKFREAQALMDLTPEQLLKQAPQLSYVYVRRDSLFSIDANGSIILTPGGDPNTPDAPLVQALLAAPTNAPPPGFRLLREMTFGDLSELPYARLFAIEPRR